MTPQPRFMNELLRIVNGALRLDVDRVRNYTEHLAKKLEGAGDSASAERLRHLLTQTSRELRPTGSSVMMKSPPADPESRFPLLERVAISSAEPSMVLTEPQQAVVSEFVAVARSFGQIESAGIGASLNLLLYGPPGCGKSRLAREIARELELDLFVARLDGLVSSFLGSTSKNIRALFEFASKNPCVLFLDEFDAIAKLRADAQELGELKRVVNSFMQNLDTIGATSIVIAATNHEELLDPAIWRRFSYRLQLGYPSSEMREQLWRMYLKSTHISNRELRLLVDLSDGFSGSDISEAGLRVHRREVSTREPASIGDAFAALLNMTGGAGQNRRFLSALRELAPADMARVLRERNSKLYSASMLGGLFGVSKATAYRWTARSVT